MENRKIRCKFWKSCIVSAIITILIPGLSGCQIIEPEKRAFPLVVGIDWQQGEYRIYLGMAQLAVSTGQGKEGGEDQQGDEEGALLLTGTSQEEIMEIYNKTQELYLDPGHVQAVIFGNGILREKEQMVHVPEDMKTVIGINGNQVESLGKYLSGIYENRTEDIHPITLSQMYRELHNQGKILQIPEITMDGGELIIEKNDGTS